MRTVFFIALFLSGNVIIAQSDPGNLSKGQWIEDLDFVVETIKTRHWNPFATVPEKTLDSLHQDIKSKIGSTSYLSIAELLYAEGITTSESSIQLAFNNDEEVTVKPIDYDQTSQWVDYLTKHDVKKPLWLQNIDNGMWKIVTNEEFFSRVDQYYWYQFMEAERSFYIKINYLFHHPNKSIAVFMNEAMTEATSKKADKIILDLRHNRGGSADVNRALKLALQRWSNISEFGKVFVIVGRHSYSAAVLLVKDLEKEFNVLLIGEELGGMPQHIGDSERYHLPNSGLAMRVSVREHHDWTGLPDRPSSWLHYTLPMAFADYRQGIDRCVKFATQYQSDDINKEIVKIYKNTNINVALLIFYHLLTDPVSAVKDHSGIAYALANYLYEEEANSRYAQALLQYNLEYYATHVPSLLLLGRIQLDTENIEEGKETLMKILTIDPTHRMAKLWLKSLSGS